MSDKARQVANNALQQIPSLADLLKQAIQADSERKVKTELAKAQKQQQISAETSKLQAGQSLLQNLVLGANLQPRPTAESKQTVNPVTLKLNP